MRMPANGFYRLTTLHFSNFRLLLIVLIIKTLQALYLSRPSLLCRLKLQKHRFQGLKHHLLRCKRIGFEMQKDRF